VREIAAPKPDLGPQQGKGDFEALFIRTSESKTEKSADKSLSQP